MSTNDETPRQRGSQSRRRIRSDTTAVAGSINGKPSAPVPADTQVPAEDTAQKVKTIRLGAKQWLIMRDVIARFQKDGRPINYLDWNVICAQHGKSPGAVVKVELRTKCAVETDGAGHVRDLDVVPVTRGVVYIDFKGQRLWPIDEEQQMAKKPREKKEYGWPHGVAPTKIEQGEFAGAWVVPSNTSPVLMSRAEGLAYNALRSHERARDRWTAKELCKVIAHAVLAYKHPETLIYALERENGCLMAVEGQHMSRGRPLLRAVVFRPYHVTGDKDPVIPPQCRTLSQEGSPPRSSADEAPASPAMRILSKEELEAQAGELEAQAEKKWEEHRCLSEKLWKIEEEANALSGASKRKRKAVEDYDEIVALTKEIMA